MSEKVTNMTRTALAPSRYTVCFRKEYDFVNAKCLVLEKVGKDMRTFAFRK